MSIRKQRGYTLIITLIIVFVLGLLSAILLNYITTENRLTVTVRTSTLLIQDFESAVEYGIAWVSAYYPNITSTIVVLPNGYKYDKAKVEATILDTSYMEGAKVIKLTILFPETSNSTSEAEHVVDAMVYLMTKVGTDVDGYTLGTTPSPYPTFLMRWRITK